jgi:hypothetical protein
MAGFITRRHVLLVWSVFGFRVALRVLFARHGATFLSLL